MKKHKGAGILMTANNEFIRYMLDHILLNHHYDELTKKYIDVCVMLYKVIQDSYIKNKGRKFINRESLKLIIELLEEPQAYIIGQYFGIPDKDVKALENIFNYLVHKNVLFAWQLQFVEKIVQKIEIKLEQVVHAMHASKSNAQPKQLIPQQAGKNKNTKK